MSRPPVTEPDPVRALTGEWGFERTVADRIGDTFGTASGTARFVPEGDGLEWIESGTLLIGDHRFDAKRRMSIRPEDGGWMVRFDDGRVFHPLDLTVGRCEVGHPCREDFYDGVLELVESDEGPELRTEWRVEGPAKDQLIRTRYRRQDPILRVSPPCIRA